MSDEEARATFQRIRWADTEGKPYCPECGCAEVCSYKSRPIWKCKACNRQFSVTSNTIFANRKLPVRDYLLAIAIFANGAKGHSALQLSRDLDCQYKTAFVLSHKLRECIAAEANGRTVSGEIEIDGAYFGGYVKPANQKENRRDRRLAENKSGKRRVVVIMRERNGRTLPFVFRSEDQAVPTIRQRVAGGSTIHADEASSWDALHLTHDVRRINHSVEYSSAESCTNYAESFLSRMRRAEIGIHHKISGHLNAYASEMAWRENNRRVPNGEQYLMIAGAAMAHPVSQQWKGYWQRGEQ